MRALAAAQLVLPALTAGCLVWWMRRAAPLSLPLLAGLAVTLGLGLAGIAELLWLLLLPAHPGLQWVIELPLLVAAARLARSRPGVRPMAGSAAASGPLTLPLLMGLGAAGLGALLAAVTVSRAFPHGWWDGWAVWNMKARYLVRAGAAWPGVFQPELMHPDYPLLLPGLIARLWRVSGMESTDVPGAVALLFTGLTVVLLVEVVSGLRGRTLGCLAGLTLLSLPHFLLTGAQQGTDMPLACFILSALCCAAQATRARHAGHDLRPAAVMAGLFAGLAAWTKLEGGLFAIALVLGFLLAYDRGRRRPRWPATTALALGFMAPGLAWWVIDAAFVRTPHGAVLGPPGVVLERLLDLDRHGLVLGHLLGFITGESRLAPTLFLLGAYALAAGRRRAGSDGPTSVLAATVLALAAVGDYLVYVTTAYDLAWYVDASLDRLIVQYWPSLIFLVCILVRSPEEALSREPEGAPALTEFSTG